MSARDNVLDELAEKLNGGGAPEDQLSIDPDACKVGDIYSVNIEGAEFIVEGILPVNAGGEYGQGGSSKTTRHQFEHTSTGHMIGHDH